MKVMKFGGSSLADARRMEGVAAIVIDARRSERVAVVLSAMKGVTDALIGAARAAERGDASHVTTIDTLRARHHEAVSQLLDASFADGVVRQIDEMLREVGELLHGVFLIRECSPRTLDLVVSFGERLSCRIVAALLTARNAPAEYVDARQIIVTDASYGAANVDFPASYGRIATRLGSMESIPVITGFIASTPSGVTTTIGRNGSDYTASIVGGAIGAGSVEIWTDVDGVLSADPRTVERAFVIPEISLQEAMELSYFGAEVIHPYTMLPAIDSGVPLWIKNTLNPSARGTRISGDTPAVDRDITGIASIDNVALVNVEGGGMLGIPGVASRVFGALAHAGVNAIMISQASSEHSICICIRESQLEAARASLERELQPELASRRIDAFVTQAGLEIVAVIGGNMRGRPGIAGRLFSALGAAAVNVLAIAQGSSEMNISFVVSRTERERALNVVHDAFFPAD